MNPIITVLLEIYARKMKNVASPTREMMILQKMKNNHMDHYMDGIRRLCSLTNAQQYERDYEEIIEEIGNHEYVIIEVLRDLLEKIEEYKCRNAK